MFDQLVAWLLLPAGIALGALWAGRQKGTFEERVHTRASDGNDTEDDAMRLLRRALEGDPRGNEFQLMLGTLHRRRGEIDRALAIHQALADQPGLDPEIAAQTRFELAEDSVRAGLFDRAEALLESFTRDASRQVAAWKRLLHVYEQTRAWEPAIEAARRLEAAQGTDMHPRIAQYRCEQASVAAPDEARRLYRQALTEDPACVRVSFAMAGMEEATGDSQGARAWYRSVLDQDARFARDAFEGELRCAEALADTEAALEWIGKKARARNLAVPEAAAKALPGNAPLPPKPSLTDLTLRLAPRLTAEADKPLLDSLNTLRRAQPRYRCQQCGLAANILYWHCPSCRSWSTVLPYDPPIA